MRPGSRPRAPAPTRPKDSRRWGGGGAGRGRGSSYRNPTGPPPDDQGARTFPVRRVGPAPRIPPPHPRIASCAFCAEAGGKSSGRSQGGSPRPRRLHSRGSRRPGQPFVAGRSRAPRRTVPRLTERARRAAPRPGPWVPPRRRLRGAPQRPGATSLEEPGGAAWKPLLPSHSGWGGGLGGPHPWVPEKGEAGARV